MIIWISQINLLVFMSFFCYHQSREIEIGSMFVFTARYQPSLSWGYNLYIHCEFIFIRWIPIFVVFVGSSKPRTFGAQRKALITREVICKYENFQFSVWLLLNDKCAIFLLYHGKNKLIFNERTALYQTNTPSLIFYSARSQQTTDSHVAPVWHIILIPS